MRFFILVLAAVGAMLVSVPGVRAQPESPVTVTAKPMTELVTPGDLVAVAVVFEHQPGWHVHTNAPVVPPEFGDFEPITTKIDANADATLELGTVQWPKPIIVDVNYGTPVKYGVFGDRAIAYLPVRVSASATPGTTATINLDTSYQACDERQCLAEDGTSLTITLQVVTLAEKAAAGAGPKDPDFAGFDPTVFASATPAAQTKPASKPVKFGAFGFGFTIDPSGPVGIVLLLLAAALGGFILNFTPCVLPVIPIKIMSLGKSAGNPARALYLGAIMFLGTVAFWVAIGLAIAFISGFTATSTLFRTPWFSLVVGLIIAAMGVGMLGAFTVQLPRAVYMLNPSNESAGGSFAFGIMTAILSTPCTAPFMGTAAAWAATQQPTLTLATFAAIGVGMALPYLVLAAFPRLVAWVPRTGPASELVKQVLGLLMLAVAAFFLGLAVVALVPALPLGLKGAYWWVVAALVCVACAWMIYRTIKITRKPANRAVFVLLGLLLAAGSVAMAKEFSYVDRSWTPYTRATYDKELARGQVVVLEFTAAWCLNCKTLEATVLADKAVKEAFRHPWVTAIKVDLTAPQAEGWAMLKELGEVGIPLLAVRGPGKPEGWKSNAYTVAQVVEAVNAAGGSKAKAAAKEFSNVEGSWTPYSSATFDKELARGLVVVLQFTADWCSTYKQIERSVFGNEAVEDAMRQPWVTAMKADLSTRQAEGWTKLRQLGEVGIPLLTVHGPGTPEGWKSNAYTPAEVVEAINAAGAGKPSAAARP
ncbi:MAG: thioredoxin family protein [Phycisphaerales bacterium]